jgi:alanine-glyoxylate transaminase/serine-glyoxylate transaminase/serine-pyruvate transaminase
MRAPFHPSEVLLLGPGPSPVSHRTLAAMSAPVLGHLDPEFVALMDRVQADLRTVFATQNAFTVPISGTGSAGMETALVNLIEPGDRVVVGIHGVFGERMHEIASRLGADVVAVRAAFGQPLDDTAMVAAIRGGATRIVAFVHAETSTGVLQPPAAILAAAADVGALTLLDCVTSLAGAPVDIDAWKVDAAYSGTQKCLGVPPGLSPVTFSAAALERIRRRRAKPPSWYLDVSLLGGYWGGERVYHHTAPISMVYALAAGLDEVLEEGLAARHRRHRDVADAFHRGLDALGLRCVVDAPLRTPMLTSIHVPDGIDDASARRLLRQRHRIEIGGGLGPWKGRVWRVGLMGHGARIASVVRVLTAFADVLTTAGKPADLAAALRAADPAGSAVAQPPR